MTEHEPTPAASAGTPLTDDDDWTVEDEIESTLKPCPRCGSKAVLDEGHSDGIHCDGCGYWTGEDMDLREAISWWNEQPLIESLRAANATLVAELQEARAWLPLEAYSEIYAETEDGERCTIGIDGDDNLYVLKQNPPSLVLTMTQGKYRLCRRAPASPPASDGDVTGKGHA